MLAIIKKSLSLKVSLTLVLVAIPLMSLAAWLIVSRQTKTMEELTLSEGKLAATLGAKMYGSALDDAIDNGYLSPAEAFDQSYQEIKGYDFGPKGKYHTKYDSFTDHAVLPIQDRILENPVFVYAVGADINGYIPTHNGIYAKPLVGNVAADQVGNRTKRIFNNPAVELPRSRNLEPILVQFYRRDTGKNLWDVSAPIFVKGKHWGCFCVGISIDEIQRRKAELLTQLAIIFGIFGLATVGLIFVMINRAMKPLQRLSDQALEISRGVGLENPIKPTTTDEVGKMAKSLDRLRASLKAAMQRIDED